MNYINYYRLKYSILTFLLCLVTQFCASQNNSKQMNASKEFIDAIIDNEPPFNVIINEYLEVKDTSKQNLEFIELQLSSLKELFRSKRIQKNELKYLLYSSVVFPELIIPDDNHSIIILVTHNSEVLIPILFDNNKIVAFNTMNKGLKRVFIKI